MSIYASPDGWVLETRNTAYAIGLNPFGVVAHRYWGARLPDIGDYAAFTSMPDVPANAM